MKDLFSLTGKTVILTGGAGNLGRVMAKGLLDYGAKLVIADRVAPSPEELPEGERLLAVRCDLADSASVREMYDEAEVRFGGIDVLICNAAWGGGAGGNKSAHRVDDVTDEIWETGMAGTAGVTFRCIREALPYFDRRGGGSIVTIASMYGMVSPDPSIYGDSGSNSPPFYGVGKAGVLQMTRFCAGNLASRGIRVNSITPGPFPNVTPQMNQELLGNLQRKTMLGRTGRPEELLGALLLLCSDASSFMTGSNLVVDGGWTAW